MQPLGTKGYILKGYSPSDSFCTFFSESVHSDSPIRMNSVRLKQKLYM